jgi:hypothetical protein
MNHRAVGATWGSHDDSLEIFVHRGYWFLGWSEDKDP